MITKPINVSSNPFYKVMDKKMSPGTAFVNVCIDWEGTQVNDRAITLLFSIAPQ